MPTMGNTGASALIRLSASTSNAIADYNDKIKALEWESSAQTDEEYAAYSKYLEGRISKLQSVGTLSAASKAATIISTSRGVTRSYISNSLQRTSQAILNGNATSYDKLEQIRTLYVQASNSGDANLAQNLYSQYQNLDQQIQYQEAQAAISNEVLATKNAKAQKAGYNSAIDAIENSVATLAQIIKSGGQAVLTGEAKAQSKEAIATLKALGVDVSGLKGKSVNNGSLISAALDSLYDLNKQAAIAVEASDPEAAVSYYNTAEAIMNNRVGEGGSINVLGTAFTKEMADQWAAQPALYHTDMDSKGNITMQKSAIAGYAYDATGKIVPVVNDKNMTIATEDWAGDKGKSERDKAIKEFETLGFTVENVNTKTGEFNVKISDKTNSMFKGYVEKNGMDKANTEFTVKKFGDNYQLFSSYTTKTGENPLLYVSKDAGGAYGLSTGNFNKLTGQVEFSYLGQSSPKYNRLNNSLSAAAGNNSALFAIQKYFTNYNTMPKGYTESTIIPDIARRFYGGDLKAAAADVYSIRKPLDVAKNQTKAVQAQQTFQKQVSSLAVKPTPVVTKATTPPKAAVPTKQSQFVSNLNTITPSFQTATTNRLTGVNQGIINEFKDYKSKPKYYTEKVIIPNILKNYFGGDKSKEAQAKQLVYKYRKETFNEGYGR